MITPSKPDKSIAKIISQPVSTWKDELKNDFEIPVFNTYPEIKKIKQELYETGAVYAAMSGSGSMMFGLFEKDKLRDKGVKREMEFLVLSSG